ncbi:MAG: hypothetical protein IT306_02830 [Chloroflexi bacterium]|nr:hypothetical protein [Chloroflexota bacterium]
MESVLCVLALERDDGDCDALKMQREQASFDVGILSKARVETQPYEIRNRSPGFCALRDALATLADAAARAPEP